MNAKRSRDLKAMRSVGALRWWRQTAMAYVDLNPIRAGIAKTPEDSEFTSIYDRIRTLSVDARRDQDPPAVIPLRAFSDEVEKNAPAIPYTFRDYLSLVDWSGRLIREDKRGAIVPTLPPPPTLKRLGIEIGSWELLMSRRETVFGRAMGKLDAMRLHAATLGQSWVRGVRRAERIYSS